MRSGHVVNPHMTRIRPLQELLRGRLHRVEARKLSKDASRTLRKSAIEPHVQVGELHLVLLGRVLGRLGDENGHCEPAGRDVQHVGAGFASLRHGETDFVVLL